MAGLGFMLVWRGTWKFSLGIIEPLDISRTGSYLWKYCFSEDLWGETEEESRVCLSLRLSLIQISQPLSGADNLVLSHGDNSA